MSKTETFWKAVGGRKMFNGYLYAALITVMVLVLEGSFAEYMMGLGGALLGTSIVVASEDRAGRTAAFPYRRASDETPPEAS